MREGVRACGHAGMRACGHAAFAMASLVAWPVEREMMAQILGPEESSLANRVQGQQTEAV